MNLTYIKKVNYRKFYKIFFLAVAFLSVSLSNSNAFSLDGKKATKSSVTVDQVDPLEFTRKAVLQILNKITAKTEKVTIPVGKKTYFGKLEIMVDKCWKSPLYQDPDSKILLEISQIKGENKNNSERIFYGWMLASSPSVSGLEHPIYDVTALDCVN